MRTPNACVLSFALATSLGCSYTGSGWGVLRGPPTAASPTQPVGPVEFSWQSGASSSRGVIEARLPDGRSFRGTYVQPSSSDVSTDYRVPAWGATASSRWGSPPPWCDMSRKSTSMYHMGPVLAHLESSDGTRMRCVFMLFEPMSGLSGGGEGDCQLSTREEVFDALLSASSAS